MKIKSDRPGWLSAFTRGSCYDEWTGNNCDQCRDSVIKQRGGWPCHAERALFLAYCNWGLIAPVTQKRTALPAGKICPNLRPARLQPEPSNRPNLPACERGLIAEGVL